MKENQDTFLKLVNKPKGMTSFDVIRVLRKKLGKIKMGHAGTLDPRASGLLIVACGEKTKELATLLGLPKSYEADILVGTRTDTGDLDGKVLETRDVAELQNEQIQKVLESLIGDINLPVPIYSAIKKHGKPLYAYAREGKGDAIEIPIKRMHIYTAECISYNPHEKVIRARFTVSSGTYIRSIAEECGKRLGTVATLKELKRTSIGNFKLEDAEELDDIC